MKFDVFRFCRCLRYVTLPGQLPRLQDGPDVCIAHSLILLCAALQVRGQFDDPDCIRSGGVAVPQRVHYLLAHNETFAVLANQGSRRVRDSFVHCAGVYSNFLHERVNITLCSCLTPCRDAAVPHADMVIPRHGFVEPRHSSKRLASVPNVSGAS